MDRTLPAFERRCIRAGPLRSALLLGRIALLFTSRRALPARRLAALGARAASSTGWAACGQTLPAFERRCIRAGPLRSALLLGRIALLFTSRRALPARRLAALGARAASSAGWAACGQTLPAFERRCIRAGPLRSALLLGRIALLFTSRRALPARRLAALGARAASSTGWAACGQTLPAFERRCIRAGPLRSALLLGRIALLFTSRRALPARRLAALGARAASSAGWAACGQTLPAFERRCIRAGPLRSALLLGRIALLFTSRRALPARRLAALGARAASSAGC